MFWARLKDNLRQNARNSQQNAGVSKEVIQELLSVIDSKESGGERRTFSALSLPTTTVAPAARSAAHRRDVGFRLRAANQIAAIDDILSKKI